MHLLSARAKFVIFDSAGIARSRSRIPYINIPYAVWIHGIEAWENLRPGAYHSLKNAKYIISNSKYTLEKFRSIHGEFNKTLVCELATEEDDKPNRYSNSKSPTILILGRIDSSENYKGHNNLIDALPEICREFPNTRLVVAGSGDGLEQLQNYASNSSMYNRVEFKGYVSQEAIPELMSEADIFAMPSRGEGFGLVYAEAMRYGIPIIASVHDAGQEINKDGMTGFNVNLEKKHDLSDKILFILRNKSVHDFFSANAQELWYKNYSFSSFHERFSKIIQIIQSNIDP